MSPVATMSKTEPEYCTYATVKVDDEVLPVARAAANLAGQRIQEWLSDLINAASAKALSRRPINRRPPKPRKTAD